eukprot:1139654-Pelagomonas_calceolata.AAC.1
MSMPFSECSLKLSIHVFHNACKKAKHSGVHDTILLLKTLPLKRKEKELRRQRKLQTSVKEKETHWGLHAAAVPPPTVVQASYFHGRRRRRRSGLGLIGSNQYSIRSAKCKSRSLRKIAWKEARGYNSVGCMNRDLEVVLHQPVVASLLCCNQACFPRAFAKSFCDHSASNILAYLLAFSPAI